MFKIASCASQAYKTVPADDRPAAPSSGRLKDPSQQPVSQASDVRSQFPHTCWDPEDQQVWVSCGSTLIAGLNPQDFVTIAI